jgi:hypothetical protein
MHSSSEESVIQFSAESWLKEERKKKRRGEEVRIFPFIFLFAVT